MKKFVKILTLTFIVGLTSYQGSIEQNNSKMTISTEDSIHSTSADCMTLCDTIFIVEDLSKTLNTLSPLDTIEDRQLYKNLMKKRDSLENILTFKSSKLRLGEYYSSEYRHECLSCWLNQYNLKVDTIASSIYSLSKEKNIFLIYHNWQRSQEIVFPKDELGNKYTIEKGVKYIITDTVQKKKEMKLYWELKASAIDSIIYPMFNQKITDFEDYELVLLKELVDIQQEKEWQK